MTYAADLLLAAASLGAAAYCMILSRRLTRLGSFDRGIGSAIAVLSAQVDEMKSALGEAKTGSAGAGQQLDDLVRQAREIAAELEMMIAACHDFAEQAIETQARPQPASPAIGDPGLEDGLRDDGPVLAFGSRRRHGRPEEETGDAIPMFRHRAAERG